MQLYGLPPHASSGPDLFRSQVTTRDRLLELGVGSSTGGFEGFGDLGCRLRCPRVVELVEYGENILGCHVCWPTG